MINIHFKHSQQLQHTYIDSQCPLSGHGQYVWHVHEKGLVIEYVPRLDCSRDAFEFNALISIMGLCHKIPLQTVWQKDVLSRPVSLMFLFYLYRENIGYIIQQNLANPRDFPRVIRVFRLTVDFDYLYITEKALKSPRIIFLYRMNVF